MLDSDREAVNAFITKALKIKEQNARIPTSTVPTRAQRQQYKEVRLRNFRRLCVTGAELFKNELSGEVEDIDTVDTLDLESVRVQTFNDGFSVNELVNEAATVFRKSNHPHLAPKLAQAVGRHFDIEEN